MHLKMKFSLVILVFTLVIVLVTASSGEINDKRFVSCNPNEWIIMNTTITWDQNTKHLSSNITKNEPGGAIYRIHITIGDCTNNTECNGSPQIYVDKVNCSNMSNTNSDEVCRAAQEAAKLEQEIQFLTFRYGPKFGKELFNQVSCIRIQENVEQRDSSSLSSSNESNDRTESSEQENE